MHDTRPAAPARPLLSIRDVGVQFGGITALQGVSLDVSPGEVVGVIGPNGAGKTTLFNLICGFVQPGSGTITYRGETQALRPDRLADLGIVRTLQGVGLFPGLTVVENVMIGANRFRRTGVISSLLALPRSDRDERELRKRALTWLEQMDCLDVADRYPPELPYPTAKRVALTRALIAEPDLLLLDEPAGGLGEDDMNSLGQLIVQLKGHCAVMLVEHHMDLVMSVCDRLCVLDFGQVIATGTPDEVRCDERVLEAYLGRDAESVADETHPALAVPNA